MYQDLWSGFLSWCLNISERQVVLSELPGFSSCFVFNSISSEIPRSWHGLDWIWDSSAIWRVCQLNVVYWCWTLTVPGNFLFQPVWNPALYWANKNPMPQDDMSTRTQENYIFPRCFCTRCGSMNPQGDNGDFPLPEMNPFEESLSRLISKYFMQIAHVKSLQRETVCWYRCLPTSFCRVKSVSNPAVQSAEQRGKDWSMCKAKRLVDAQSRSKGKRWGQLWKHVHFLL